MPKLVSTSIECQISGSNQAYIVSEKDRHGKPLRNVISQESGLIFVDPVPFENTEEFYKTEYRKSYKGVHRPKPKHVYRAGKIALERHKRIRSLIGEKAVTLDAGSSSGEFVYLMQKRGHSAEGIEANLPYAEYSRSELQINVSIQPFSEFTIEEKFDLITMFHVLEHLEHPVRDLMSLSKTLKPEGHFVIEVPNILYPHMAFPHKWHSGHLFSYTAETLSHLMKQTGFDTIKCSPIGDGGNLWGVFRKSEKENTVRLDAKREEAMDVVSQLRSSGRLYYLNIRNYLKFFAKLRRQLIEKKSSKGKSGREILDKLY
ncbi:MAG: class I SAM-dependent methyltransferase [Opitutae bacterium]|jgi:2-polyprenyl-3-methyl-5-hydroxy-6-metoxy-1,4-benzoquinol methylase|nr:class I SAM-dependent methyltransferase [Opitutae bacterium]MBT6851508.1 class I SAM-dependent methyltransferase [Opitutae bacterium]MBT7741161.1 class I SAM-dependent methyltransferase [Opitutae bacterium]MBT7923793.1 class I SAM-dependent methyltransferase [Opitutae bacterium]